MKNVPRLQEKNLLVKQSTETKSCPPHGGQGNQEGPPETSGRCPPPGLQGPTSSEGASLVLVPGGRRVRPSPLRTKCWVRRHVSWRGSGDGSHHLPGPPRQERGVGPSTAPSCHRPTETITAEEKAVWGGKGRKEIDAVVLQACLFWYQHSVTVTKCLGGETPKTARWCACTHARAHSCAHMWARLRAPATSARSAWRSCKTVPGHPATFWRHPRWPRFHRWALKEKENLHVKGLKKEGPGKTSHLL